jgi:hypothetical protein
VLIDKCGRRILIIAVLPTSLASCVFASLATCDLRLASASVAVAVSVSVSVSVRRGAMFWVRW